MSHFIQANLQRSRAADAMLEQLACEVKAQVVIVSEPYRVKNSPSWFYDGLGTAAVWIPDSRGAQVLGHGSGDGYVWVRLRHVTVYSVYLSPNYSAEEYRGRLEALEDNLQSVSGGVIVAGDFNARAVEWGMPVTNARGRHILEMASRLDLEVANRGSMPTFRRPGFGESIPDITLVSATLSPLVAEWKVMDVYTASDHEFISFHLKRNDSSLRHSTRNTVGWNVARLDRGKFVERLSRSPEAGLMAHLDSTDRDQVESLVGSTMQLIERACDSSMPPKRPYRGRRQVFWWTDEIAELRRIALMHRRRAQRARNRPEAAARSAEHKAAKKALASAIRRSKARCWKELCEDVDSDPWGKGYKLVTRKLGGMGANSAFMPAGTVTAIVNALFPNHPVRREERVLGPVPDVPLFTEQELVVAVSNMRNNKAPGPDRIPAEALKVVAGSYPHLLLRMFNSCLVAGVFPARWKTARLALISKGKGDPESPSAYRPLCMLDTAGKLFERLLKPRLQSSIEAAGDLSPRQHGFRKGHSTLNAVNDVLGAVQLADTASHKARPIVLLVTLDVKNAFNSARWVDMLEALHRHFRVPDYLLVVVQDYLKDRRLLYETEEGRKTRVVTAGAAQGSILGPDLWNVSYDGLLRLDMPHDVFLVGYADDVAAVITARNPELAQLRLTQVMIRVNTWMRSHGLELAIAKTEIVMLTRRRIPKVIPMTVGNVEVQTKAAAKYLGVMLDCRLTWWEHIQMVCDRAAMAVASLSGLMANVGGPRSSKRRLLMSTVNATLLYGAEVWAGAMKVKKYSKRILSVQRRAALRVACAYRSVSGPAVMVVAGVIPLDLLAVERQCIFRFAPEIGRNEAAAAARLETMQAWQDRWDSEVVGRWTHRLIRDLAAWVNRGHGEIDFFLCQFLTGHGYFRKYLHRMGKVGSSRCLFCPERDDDVHHTFFECERFIEERRLLNSAVGPVFADTVVEVMLRGENEWREVFSYIHLVLRAKWDEGCLGDP
jgi:hypothetical protein